MRSIKLLLCDDHTLFLNGLKSLLKNEHGIHIIGEALNGCELIDKYFILKPDIVLADIAMPKLSGMDALKQIKKRDPEAKIIFLSALIDEQYIYHAYKNDASGFITKEIDKSELLYALDCVYDGQLYYGEKYSVDALEELKGKFELGNAKLDLLYGELSRREKDVLVQMTNGKSRSQIGDALYISEKTVDAHLRNIREKFNLKGSAQLMRFAFGYVNSLAQSNGYSHPA